MKKMIGIGLLFSLLVAGCGTDTPASEDTEEAGANDPSSSEDSNASSEGIPENTMEDSITVSFDFEIDDDLYEVDESTIKESVDTAEGTTLMEVMKEKYEIEEEGGLITSIEGYEQNEAENIYWLYEINGETATIGAADYTVEDQDQITWTLEPYEQN